VPIVASGQLADHSAPRVVAALAARGFTGELTVGSEGRAFRIAWADGAIVGAKSPHPADSAAKIALTLGVLSSTQAGEVARIVSSNPGVDELDVIAQAARLPSDILERLARRVAAARSARAMSMESGTYSVSDEAPFWGNVAPVDARWVLYSGIRQHFTIDRTERELGSWASAVRLRSQCDLDGFGFGEAEGPVIERLHAGELPLSSMSAALDQQVAQAVVLALLLVGEAEVTRAPARPVVTPAPVSPPSVPQVPDPVPLIGIAPMRSPNPKASRSTRATTPVISSTKAPMRSLHSATVPRPERVQALIAERLAVLDAGGDHFTLLGVSETSGPNEIRTKYFDLARHLHPDRLKAAEIADHKKDGQRLFARINEAFSVLTEPAKRTRYMAAVRAGGESALIANEVATETAVRRALEAEERFRHGEMALRRQQFDVAVREFQKAVDLHPEEADHHALLGWAWYVAAANKASAVPIARGHLMHAIEINQRCANAFLGLGRIARMEGNEADALKHFHNVIALVPGHQEAMTELRAIEARRKR
jgi:hypothetical protein